MTERVKRLYAKQQEKHVYPMCVERVQIMSESTQRNEGAPEIIKRAISTAEYMDKRTIYIEDDELLIYNISQKPNGMEIRVDTPTWEDEDFDQILADGTMTITDEERKIAHKYDDYYSACRAHDAKRIYYYTESTVLPYAKRGVQVPPWTPTSQRGGVGASWANKYAGALMTPDYEYQLKMGFEEYVRRCKEKLDSIHLRGEEDIEKVEFLRASIIGIEGCIRLGYRYADLAEKMSKECKDPVRAKELAEIAEVCRQVPAKPARTFREAIQAWLFYFYLNATGALGCGRMDQYLYPYYKADLEAGRITRDQALELIECLRLKLMQFQVCSGGKFQREKWAGLARWNNIILGGTNSKGEDATNELSYLFLEAAKEVRTTHPTMTIRVHKNSPAELLQAGVDLVATGIGMPAFISEDSYINYIAERGVPIERARDFAIAGCLDITLPGAARMNVVSMFVVPIVFETAVYGGKNIRTGEQFGPVTKELKDCATYEEFYGEFKKQMDYFIDMYCEYGVAKMYVDTLYPDVFVSAFFRDTLDQCKDIMHRKMEFENGISFNVVGMANTINSFAALKKVVYEDKVCSPAAMQEALYTNWKDNEDLRKACLDAPKYGNDDAYVDDLGSDLWVDLRTIAESHTSMWGEPLVTSAISISAHAPGGKLTSATPDGRYDGDVLADGSASPVQGTDKNGPVAVFNSAMKMSKGWSVNLLNMKFSPNALKTVEDKAKLAALVKTFLTNGGKHVQFNVVDRATLQAALEDKEKYKNLIVRVAGYSAYYVELTSRIQKEVMDRTENVL